jgi:hypothetical protein
MKIIKIVLLALCIIFFVGIVVVTIFVMTFDINQFKPQIIHETGKTLNRRVNFSSAGLHFSLRKGISVQLNDLIVADDPLVHEGDFLTAKNISLEVDVLDYVFRKEVNVSSVTLDSVHATVIRQKDGSLNIESIARPSGTAMKDETQGKIEPPVLLPAILVSSLKMRNCMVSYIDYSTIPATEIDVSDVDIAVSDISFTEPFSFTLDGAVVSGQQNIHVEGMLRVDLATGELTLSQCKGMTDLSDIIVENIPRSFPTIDKSVVPASLSGQAECTIEKMRVGPQGMMSLSSKVRLSNGAVMLKTMAFPINNVQLAAVATQANINLEKMSAGIGGGTIAGTGTLEDYAVNQVFNININATNIILQDLLARDKTPAQAEGIISGNVQLQGRGFSEQALHSFLSGYGIINTKNVTLKDINILRMAFDKIAIIPNLAQKVEAKLPDNYRIKLSQNDTVLKDSEFPFAIENGRLIVKHMVVAADEFLFRGSLQASLDGSFSVEGTLTIPSDLSSFMIRSVSELQYLLNEKQEIAIPLKVSGQSSETMKMNIDAEYMSKRLLVNQGTQQLLKILDKNISGNTPATATKTPNTISNEPRVTQEQPQSPQPPDSNKKVTTEEVVSGVLGAIFKNTGK